MSAPSDSDKAHRVDAVGLVNVSHRYGQTRALTSVSLTLGRGTTVLLGRNGAGKSTLCRILTGLEPPTTGAVERAGTPIETTHQWRQHHAHTGWLPQSLAVPMSMTIDQYLRYAAWLKGLTAEESMTAIDDAIIKTDLSSHRRKRLKHLSGGTLRRAGIAQAIVHAPSLVVLDEPTVGLDPEQRSWFHEIIRELSSDRCLLISTHLLEDVEALAQRVIILDEGAVRFDDTVDRLRALGGGQDTSPQAALRAGFMSVVQGREP